MRPKQPRARQLRSEKHILLIQRAWVLLCVSRRVLAAHNVRTAGSFVRTHYMSSGTLADQRSDLRSDRGTYTRANVCANQQPYKPAVEPANSRAYARTHGLADVCADADAHTPPISSAHKRANSFADGVAH